MIFDPLIRAEMNALHPLQMAEARAFGPLGGGVVNNPLEPYNHGSSPSFTPVENIWDKQTRLEMNYVKPFNPIIEPLEIKPYVNPIEIKPLPVIEPIKTFYPQDNLTTRNHCSAQDFIDGFSAPKIKPFEPYIAPIIKHDMDLISPLKLKDPYEPEFKAPSIF